LHHHPEDRTLREALAVGEDILNPDIREREIRNWLEHLVLPALRR